MTSDRSRQTRPVATWSRGDDLDEKTLRRLYIDECRTERAIAQLLKVSRPRVAEAMARAGIGRRTSQRICPLRLLSFERRLVTPETTVATWLAVSASRTPRWLGGWLMPDFSFPTQVSTTVGSRSFYIEHASPSTRSPRSSESVTLALHASSWLLAFPSVPTPSVVREETGRK